MNPSPLQLKWVAYPSASYDHTPDFEPSKDREPSAVPEVVTAITWDGDGDHMASLTLNGGGSDKEIPYRFSVTVAAVFSVDLDLARKAYRPKSNLHLPAMIGVNVASLLYGGAREHVAMMTARAPYGALQIASVMIEASDINFGSTMPERQALQEIFGVESEVLDEMEKREPSTNRSSKRKR